MGPRDASPRFGVAINTETGQPLTDSQSKRLEALTEACERFRSVMHDAEGSSTDDGWDFRNMRMQRAADCLEMALMLARKVACEVP